ncbi:MAG: hypothetical protein IJI22_02870 [Bacilli bacterium]|nr:hypothetical protein [Bacilli bacterium]
MENLEKISINLLKSTYFDQDMNKYIELWKEIKKDENILNQAIELKRAEDGTQTVQYPIIAEAMLLNYDNVNKKYYNKLINLIFSNISVARTFVAGKEKNPASFLILALWNKDLKLTKEQKDFAETEALKRIQEQKIQQDPVSKELNIDPFKTALVHGTDPYDIKYYLLTNPNWTHLDKIDLADKFWQSDKEFQEYLEQLEDSILKKISTKERRISKDMLKDIALSYNYYDIVDLMQNETEAKKVFDDLALLRELKEIELIRAAKKNIWWKI